MILGIKNKLILALLLANGLPAFAIYWITTETFSSNFQEYIHRSEAQKLQPFMNALASRYQKDASWQWIQDDHREWRSIIHRHMFSSEGPPFRPEGRRGPPRNLNESGSASGETRAPRAPFSRPPQGRSAFSFDPNVLLRDTEQNLIIGRRESVDSATWLAIELNGKVVGELGLLRRSGLTDELDVFFVEQQKYTFAAFAVGMVFIALLVAILLANHFIKPLQRIGEGVNRLASGDYNQRLETDNTDELRQLASDINTLAEALDKAKQLRQSWIADISHELRTPVTILQGELEAMLDGVIETDREAILSLQAEALRLGSLINDLHELSLSDIGSLTCHKEPIDMVDCVSDFLNGNKNRIEQAGLTLNLKSFDQAVMVLADEGRIEQLLGNLLQNTLRYTDAPGELNVSFEHRKRDNENCLEIRWQDSSPGVSDEELSRLFDRLYRVEASRNREKGGAGLGMSISKSIVEAHSGNIQLHHSDLGGLEVKIILPIIES